MGIDDPLIIPTVPNPLKEGKLRQRGRKKKPKLGTLGQVLQSERARQQNRLRKNDLNLAKKAKEIADAANSAIEAREGAYKALKAQLEPRMLVSILDAVGSGLTLTEACQELEVDPNRVRRLMSRDEEYRTAYFAARESGKQLKIDSMLDIGLERAKEKSDLLYIFLMKALDPSVFNDRLVISGTGHKGELLFGTVKDLIADSRLDKYPVIEAQRIEKLESSKEAENAEVLRGNEEALSEAGEERGRVAGECGEDFQREDQEAERASDGAELRGEGEGSQEGEGPESLLEEQVIPDGDNEL